MDETQTSSQIARNIEARQSADAAMEFVNEIAMGLSKEQLPRFYEAIANIAAHGCGKVVADPPDRSGKMTFEEAKAFRKELVTFGKYQDWMVRDVPADYWIWLTESEFNLKLRRYLQSDLFQSELHWDQIVTPPG